MNKKERLVAAIENGTVIDHIPSDKTFQVVNLLGLANLSSVLAPNVVLNIIRGYEVVEKKTVVTPDELHGIVKCNNPVCVTNNEPMSTFFTVVDKTRGVLRCHYCDKEQDMDKVEIIL